MANTADTRGRHGARTAAARSAGVASLVAFALLGGADAALAADLAASGSPGEASECAVTGETPAPPCPPRAAAGEPAPPAAEAIPQESPGDNPTNASTPTATKGQEPSDVKPATQPVAAEVSTTVPGQRPTSGARPTQPAEPHSRADRQSKPGNRGGAGGSHETQGGGQHGQGGHGDGGGQDGSAGESGHAGGPQGENGGDEETAGTGEGSAWVGPGGRGGRGHGHGRNRADEADRDPASGQADLEPGGAAAAPPAALGISGAPYPITDRSPIPPFLVPIYRACGAQYEIPWHVLAAINKVETGFGANLNVSSAGAVGWMQFLPSTWAAYGVDADGDGRRDPYEPKDAVCAAARYLQAAGGGSDLPGAVFAYNHADWYVDLVLGLARQYAGLELDPLPRQRRLDRGFARRLARTANEHDADWALVLAVIRARGGTGRIPASPARLRVVAERLSGSDLDDGKRRAASGRLAELTASVFGRPRLAREVEVLTRYHRAVGLEGLVKGLYAVGGRLERRVLASKRLALYPGGRDDVAAGRIDGRVLVLLLYLAQRYDEISVTSLITGHGYYARPGVPSAHVSGLAVDIATINGTPVLGNQHPGGVVERAVHDILLLPRGLRPAQLISLFEFGGPSFAAADHADHLHVGY
jgi:hypothetical protein